jgi:hypothetical protein
MRRALFLTLALAAAALLPTPARADTQFGIRGGFYVDAGDPFLGVELLTRLDHTRWMFNPNLEYVFSEDAHLWTINGDFHYDFHQRRGHYLWAGAGLAVVTTSPKHSDGDSNTDLGLNLIAGAGFRSGGVTPYAQVKAIVKDGSELVLAVGLRF